MDTQFENFSKIGCLFELFKLMMNPLLNITFFFLTCWYFERKTTVAEAVLNDANGMNPSDLSAAAKSVYVHPCQMKTYSLNTLIPKSGTQRNL